MKMVVWLAVTASLVAAGAFSMLVPGRPATAAAELYPDLQMVVPSHLQLVNQQQRELLRFTTGIANTGDGPWALRPEFQPLVTVAHQEIRDASGNVVLDHVAGSYEFHPTHNHWHIADVARFEVRTAPVGGMVVGGNSQKVGFCLIDWYRIGGNAPTRAREFFDCEQGYQGVSVGWVDQYHHSLDGQQVDLTGVPDGDYYFVATANPAGSFWEKDATNNTAWVKFRLSRSSQGNRKIEVLQHSPCASGLCGESSTNR